MEHFIWESKNLRILFSRLNCLPIRVSSSQLTELNIGLALVVADIVDGTVHFTFYDSWEPSRRSAGPSHIADVRLYLDRYMNRLPEEQRLTLRYSW